MLSFSSQISVLVLMLLCAVTFHRSFCCHDRDRTLLLIFKQGVVDPSKRLSSWSSTNEDCCSWQGVICNFNTSRVQTLDLGNLNKNGSESLGGEINLSSLLALEFLDWLQLGHNDFERISTPSINTSIATHSHFPANFSLLSFMDLSYNVHLRIDNLHWLSKLPFLKILYLSGVHLPSGTKWVHSLALLPLKGLYLNDCNLNSSILSLEHANFSSLSSLDLGLNDFTCGLPNWLFNLSKDLYDLHLNQCNLRGPVPDFSGYRNLQILYLSNNKLNGLIPDWLGKHLRLCDLDLSINSFHGSIPSNLANMSSLSYLNISFNNLSGALPKNIDQITFFILDVSHNSISGDISKLKLQGGIFMSFNKFKGQLPQVPYYGVEVLDLAHNSFSGSLSSLCGHIENGTLPQLKYLDLSDNYLTGELPNCLNNWTDLSYIYLGNNQLVRQLPPMIGSFLDKLRALDLHNNGFSGQVPWTIHNCTSLVLINLEGNHFSGSIPTWMPQNVSIVKLRSNQFTGNIPPQLCSLSSLIVLDLANNKLSGSIPHCLFITSFLILEFFDDIITGGGEGSVQYLQSLREFRIDLQTKDQQLEYEKILNLVRGIDLSANKLSGEIPVELFKITKLQFLNLSYNYLVGEIPEQVGEMKDIESLDFSHNNLHGNIPQSMSGLSFLSVLNLSYNHFGGQIPLGTQLQSFDAWSYTGNPELCGAPLQNNCTVPKKPNDTKHVEGNDDDTFLRSLYLGMGVGFAVGFWVICGSLFLNRAWRHTYFQFLYGVIDQIYVFVAIKLRRFG